MSEVLKQASLAKQAAYKLAGVSHDERTEALYAMAQALRANMDVISDANALDVKRAQENGVGEGLIDRLALNGGRIEDMAKAIEAVAKRPDPLAEVLDSYTLKNALQVVKKRVPLGLVAMIYEARPNVTSDACAVALKSGNAVILRGGSLAHASCQAIVDVLQKAAYKAGLPEHCIEMVQSTERCATLDLLQARGLVDVLIPRGGAGLISYCLEHALVPLIETGTGNCHVYVHASADLTKARSIILNAKCQRTSVCNACESVLIDASIAPEIAQDLAQDLLEHKVVIHSDQKFLTLLPQELKNTFASQLVLAHEDDWAQEYLGLEVSIRTVTGIDEAIEHINHFGTHHSEAIVASDEAAIELFFAQVDSAAVYANASTRFTDGSELGLGAEIGISTQKLHARGPFAAEALTTYKYLIKGSGQVRT